MLRRSVRNHNTLGQCADAIQIYERHDEDHAPSLLQYLEKVLLKLLLTSPTCMLLPKSWDRYWPVLQRLASRHPEAHIETITGNLDRRARRLIYTTQQAPGSSRDHRRRVLQILDAVELEAPVQIEQLALQCMDTSSNIRSIVSAALEWASSLFRNGCHRIYLVTRLIRKWSLLSADTDDAILAYLLAVENKAMVDQRNVFRIVAELIRSRTFSLGKYLQWLIATGCTGRDQELASVSFLSVSKSNTFL